MATPTTGRARRGAAASGTAVDRRPNRFQLSLLTPMLARAARDVVAQLDQPVLLVSRDDVVRFVNASFLATLPLDGPIEGRSLFDIAGGAFDTPALRDQLARVRGGGRVHGWRFERSFPMVGSKVLSVDLVAIRGGFFETGLTVIAMRDETARAVLESDIARRTHDETELATRLSRLRAGETSAATAERIIDEMGRVPGYDYLVVGSFGAGHQLLPLALRVPPTAPLATGRPIPEARSRYLRERALTGPWIESWQSRPEDGSYGAQMMASGLRAAAYAPIHGPTSLVGLLMMGTSSATNAERMGDQFPAVLSFAAIAGALLGPAQERHNQEVEARIAIEAIIAEGAFEPVFQPVVELATGRIVGYEALTRFADGASPAERFAEAWILGVGRELELACARRSVEAADALPEGAWIGVNASPAVLLGGPELAWVLVARRRDILIEITEHAAVPDYAALHRAIAELGDRVRVAVDDAGAGYSGLQRILELRPDLIKLDIAVVRGIDGDPARQALVAGMVHFAVQTDARLLAEGVETRAEAEALLDLGVELGQGFLFGRPESVKSTSSRVMVS